MNLPATAAEAASIIPDSVTRLDALLEAYLDRLDAYQTLREQLSGAFSHGFLSLAHANRTSNLGCGRRYGEEAYDERMKAGRRVKIRQGGKCDAKICLEKGHQHKASSLTSFVIEEDPEPLPDLDDLTQSPSPEHLAEQDVARSEASEDGSRETEDSNTTRTTASSPAPIRSSTSTTDPSTTSPIKSTLPKKQPNQTPKKRPNPLHWYGVLVPSSLRATQRSFTSALEGPIPQLLTLQAEMAELEAKIRQARLEVQPAPGGGGRVEQDQQPRVDRDSDEETLIPPGTSHTTADAVSHPTQQDSPKQTQAKTSSRRRTFLATRPGPARQPPQSRRLETT